MLNVGHSFTLAEFFLYDTAQALIFRHTDTHPNLIQQPENLSLHAFVAVVSMHLLKDNRQYTFKKALRTAKCVPVEALRENVTLTWQLAW